MITALTAQNTQGVEAVLVVPAGLRGARKSVPSRATSSIAAVKIGMLATSEIIEAVAGALETLPGVPVVLDPVMVAASGDVLLDEDAIETLRAVLVPRATLITPNLPEAAKLLGGDAGQG